MRKVPLVTGEYYHIYNRGVDKRVIFADHADLNRFFICLSEFNSVEPVGSIYAKSFATKKKKYNSKRLVDFIAYCLNPNHYHLLLYQVTDGGISEFLKRLNGGYTNYFNKKHKRVGSLFQGTFRSSHVDSNEYLLHLSAYINLNNNEFLQIPSLPSKSSWGEYIGVEKEPICNTEIILSQFRSKHEYQEFAESSWKDVLARKEMLKGLESDLGV